MTDSPTRRDALGYLAGTVALASLGLPAFTANAATAPDLCVVQGGDIPSRLSRLMEEAGGVSRYVSRGDKVVIKPNIGFGNPPERGSTTDPRVVRALAELVLAAGARQVLVFDYPCHHPDIAFEISGIKKALEGLDQTVCYNLKGSKLFREVPIPAGKALRKQEVAIDILEADTIINLPCAKSHSGAKVSFGMKNWMGVVKERKWWHAGVDLHQAIADIATLIKPKLTILDATRALVTGGPAGPGEVKDLNTLVAGVDPVALDTFALSLALWGGSGYSVDQVKYLGMAAASGVGRLDVANLDIRRISL